MAVTREEVLNAALDLSESDRLFIADKLLATLPDDWAGLDSDDPQFTEELQRRSGDWEGAVTWEQLKTELRPPE